MRLQLRNLIEDPMSVKNINLLGGESVYCINQDQLKSAYEMAYENPETSPKIQAEVERLEEVPLLAKKYNAKLIALTMGKSGIPVGADERVNIAIEKLIPRMLEIDYPIGPPVKVSIYAYGSTGANWGPIELSLNDGRNPGGMIVLRLEPGQALALAEHITSAVDVTEYYPEG